MEEPISDGVLVPLGTIRAMFPDVNPDLLHTWAHQAWDYQQVYGMAGGTDILPMEFCKMPNGVVPYMDPSAVRAFIAGHAGDVAAAAEQMRDRREHQAAWEAIERARRERDRIEEERIAQERAYVAPDDPPEKHHRWVRQRDGSRFRYVGDRVAASVRPAGYYTWRAYRWLNQNSTVIADAATEAAACRAAEDALVAAWREDERGDRLDDAGQPAVACALCGLTVLGMVGEKWWAFDDRLEQWQRRRLAVGGPRVDVCGSCVGEAMRRHRASRKPAPKKSA